MCADNEMGVGEETLRNSQRDIRKIAFVTGDLGGADKALAALDKAMDNGGEVAKLIGLAWLCGSLNSAIEQSRGVRIMTAMISPEVDKVKAAADAIVCGAYLDAEKVHGGSFKTVEAALDDTTETTNKYRRKYGSAANDAKTSTSKALAELLKTLGNA